MQYALCLLFIGLHLLVDKIHANDNFTYPSFPQQAEFTVERIVYDGQSKRELIEYIYDYNNNRLITINDKQFQYYNYTILKTSIYSKDAFKQCITYPIDIDNPSDGLSAISNSINNTTYIRPLQDLLLLTSSASYIGEKTLRGSIHVTQWTTSISNSSMITWSFVKPNYNMPWNSNNYSIPVQRIIKRISDGAILETWNIFSYKPMIIRNDLLPPKGVRCRGLISDSQLITLQDFGMKFPDKFSVRIDASTSIQQLWQTAQLRFYSSSDRKFIRYDFTTSDTNHNPTTIILDYTDDRIHSYTIDRRTGSCNINDSSAFVIMTSILHDPIRTLIKYENLLISSPLQAYQYVGDRQCRSSILCSILIGEIVNNFPPDSEKPWERTVVEWGWSKKNIDDANATYDYPIYLNLNLYSIDNEPPSNVLYEFFDYRTSINLNEFDISLCYRSNQLWYQHLALQLRITNQLIPNGLENASINRRRLAEYIRERMVTVMAIKHLRVSQIEIDHFSKQSGHNDSLYCIFTLLDRTPFSNPNSEIELLDAKQKLEDNINSGQFRLQTDDGLSIEAIPNSLENLQYFYSFNINQTDIFSNLTVHVNRTIIETIEQIHENIHYSDGAKVGAVVGGTVVGILFGTLTIFILISLIKRKMNNEPTGGLHFRNISFRIRKNRNNEQTTISMEDPTDQKTETES